MFSIPSFTADVPFWAISFARANAFSFFVCLLCRADYVATLSLTTALKAEAATTILSEILTSVEFVTHGFAILCVDASSCASLLLSMLLLLLLSLWLLLLLLVLLESELCTSATFVYYYYNNYYIYYNFLTYDLFVVWHVLAMRSLLLSKLLKSILIGRTVSLTLDNNSSTLSIFAYVVLTLMLFSLIILLLSIPVAVVRLF